MKGQTRFRMFQQITSLRSDLCSSNAQQQVHFMVFMEKNLRKNFIMKINMKNWNKMFGFVLFLNHQSTRAYEVSLKSIKSRYGEGNDGSMAD